MLQLNVLIIFSFGYGTFDIIIIDNYKNLETGILKR